MAIRLAAVVLAGLATIAFVALDGEDGAPAAPAPRAVVAEAATRTLEAGPMRVDAIVRAPRFRYRVGGRLDPSRGYRLCGPITRAPDRSWLGVRLWLEGRRGAYGTLTARGEGCTRPATWFDDHPPTLPFSRRPLGYRPPPGAEDYLHAALVALAGLDGPALSAAAPSECGRARCYDLQVDFARLDREPPSRNEDGWTLRPLLRGLGRHPVAVRVDDRFLDRLTLVARPRLRGAPRPVRVELRLSRFGAERGVPRVVATSME